jgi:hypothetical protein
MAFALDRTNAVDNTRFIEQLRDAPVLVVLKAE